jgi:hypothetical protein
MDPDADEEGRRGGQTHCGEQWLDRHLVTDERGADPEAESAQEKGEPGVRA